MTVDRRPRGLKVEAEQGGESNLTFDEAMAAIATFVGHRVLVSMADRDLNACGSVFGVLKRRLDVGDDSETGALSAFDIGVNGLMIVTRAAYVGARWRSDEDGAYLALQNGLMLLLVRRQPRRPEEEGI